jgi:signal transduction histidine kinase/Tfp pilus assembly protein PilF
MNQMELIGSLLENAQAEILRNNLVNAGNLAFQALEIIRTNSDIPTQKILEAYNLYTTSLWIRGMAPEALPLCEKAVELLGADMHNPLRGRLLNNLGIVHSMLGHPEKALHYMHKALEFHVLSNQPDELANVYANIGSVLRITARFDEALEYYEKALSLYLENSVSAKIPQTYGNIGNIYYGIQEFEPALEYYQKALFYAEEYNNTITQADMIGNIGAVYSELSQFDKALEYMQKCMVMQEELGRVSQVARVISNMANVLSETKVYDQALEYMQKAYHLYQELDMKPEIAQILANLGALYEKQNIYEIAYDYFLKALDQSEKAGIESETGRIYGELGRLLGRKNNPQYNPQQGKELLKKGLYILKELGIKAYYAEFLKEMAMLHQQEGEWQESCNALQELIIVDRELRRDDAANLAERLDNKRKLELLRKEKELSELKNIELEKANKFKTSLLGIAAHDLKNPLSNIKGYAQILCAKAEPESPEYEMLNSIYTSSEQMFRLVLDLLESGAVDSSSIKLELTDTIPALLIEYSLPELNALATAKQQNIIRNLEHFSAATDIQRFRQIINNLLSNAIKYSPAGSDIHINLFSEKNEWVVQVIDQGPGIPTQEIPLLFREFQKLSPRPTAGEHSSGLGLSIAKKITTAMGGSIDYSESKLHSQGACFTVRIPFQKSDADKSSEL